MDKKEESLAFLLRYRNSKLAWMVLLIALLMTASLWQLSILLVKDRTKAHFENQSQQLKTAIEERLLNYEQVLAGSAGLFAVADLIGRDDWRTYVTKLDIERYYPGIQGIGFTEKVTEGGVADHIEKIRSQGLPNYLLSPTGSRHEYHPVVFLEPATQRNRKAFGYDAFGDPAHRKAMEMARDSGQAAMTGKVVLVQEQVDETQPGFVMYFPVYESEKTLITTDDRRATLNGFVFSAFRMNNLMDGIVGLIAPFLDVRIYDSDVIIDERLMYASNLGNLDDVYSFENSRTIEHGGKTWLLLTRTTPAFDFLASDPRPTIVLISGVIVSFLVFIVTLILLRSRLIALANAGRYRAITEDTTNITVIINNDGVVSYSSPSCERILGYNLAELKKQSPESIVHPDDFPITQASFEDALKKPGLSVAVNHARIKHKDGRWMNMEGSYTAMQDVPGVRGVVVNFRDLTALKVAQTELHRLAFYDQLTGLANRQLFKDRLKHTVITCKRRGHQAALLFLDLDGFKRINDTLGHDAGDMLLKQVAGWLKNCVRDEDSVARLGGDEFTVLLSEVANSDAVAKVADSILNALSQTVRLHDHDIGVTVSIGIAMIPSDSDDATSLMKFADLAMYRAKEVGRNNYQFFLNSMNIRAARRMLMQEELRNAIELSQFVLHYQPTVKLSDQSVVGMEALVRWNHPDRGIVAPDQFIQLAEDSGLIHKLGEWVFRQACLQCVALEKAGFENYIMSLNLSTKQVSDLNFIDLFARVVEETGVDITKLELELPANMLMLETQAMMEFVQSLKRLGVMVSLDDFGTGYCSLGSLSQVPIDSVKIDRLFVKGIPYDQKSREVTNAVIALAHKLNLNVIAEGVETREQLKFLQEANCELAQGNLFSHALDEEQLAGYLSNLEQGQKERFIYGTNPDN
ncbi:bifunctional diguanylate cyclase/phosphodiesterase [Alkalimarinus alittae]|uniref:EAL domain-containing protein n=1 Tax=Alkalimarinus alittae TaxID=2961619 RepID=A0ABY6MZL8_9ALTE|nr:EAL domain-containing protein [Alkalimarinus alittae]UZE95230.1 EAL domain-containing protein [Alkalimarinus alittae]